MAECLVTGGTTGMLKGICPDCDRIIYRNINLQKLDALRCDLDVTVTRAGTRLAETTKPHVNCDSSEGDQL